MEKDEACPIFTAICQVVFMCFCAFSFVISEGLSLYRLSVRVQHFGE